MTVGKPSWSALPVRYDENRSLLHKARALFFQEGEQAYVDWLCGDNPAGTAYCYMAVDGETIAGQYIIVPILLAARGEKVKACLSLDTFTHENYRKQGIFVSLAERVYGDAESDGCRFTLGLPNDNSRPGFLKNLNFIEPFALYQSVLPLPFRRLVGSRIADTFGRALCAVAAPFERGLQIRTVTSIDSAWGDALWERLRGQSDWNLWKDGDWLRWRFCENPKFAYHFIVAEDDAGRPSGYLVWSRDTGARGAWLVDVEGIKLSTRLALIRHMVREAAPEFDWVKSIHTTFSRYGRALTLSGFIPYRKASLIFRAHGLGLDGLPPLTAHGTDISTALADFV